MSLGVYNIMQYRTPLYRCCRAGDEMRKLLQWPWLFASDGKSVQFTWTEYKEYLESTSIVSGE